MSSSSGPESHLNPAGLEQIEEIEQTAPRVRALGTATGPRERGGGWVTAAWALPGTLWLVFYLVLPLVFIVLVSFWTYKLGAKSGFTTNWTLENYGTIVHSSTYWHNMLTSVYTSLIAVAACLILGFPIAYFLALKVHTLRNQIALFVIALAPFWTSFLVRSVAWTYPLSDVLGFFGVTTPSTTSVRLAMIQLYILFMVTPLFFTLSQVDRTALEAARDLGGNWFQTFREVILPQTMPGIVIGSIFIFVLTMGEYGTVRVIGGNAISSVGTIVQSKVEIAVQYPQGSASAVLLVLALVAGVFVITRFSNLREDL
jgi:putative spermidine/putrescine transport system permease protein